MQRLATLKLLYKIPRNATNSTLSNPYTFTQYTTLSSSKNGVFLQKRLFPPYPFVAKHCFSNTLYLKGQSRNLFLASAKSLFPSKISLNSYARIWRSGFRRLTSDSVVLGLILTNVGVFMLWRVADRSFMIKNFMISVDNFRSGRVHTLITSAFSHIDTGHLISNMVGLYFFGTSMGRTFGPEYLLKLYLAGAAVGSIFFLVHHAFIAPSMKGKGVWGPDPSKIPGLGASGAVNAIMLLDIFLFPKKTLYFDFIIPVPAILLGIFLIGRDALRILEGDTQISGSAHLGGAAVAAVAWARVRRGYF